MHEQFFSYSTFAIVSGRLLSAAVPIHLHPTYSPWYAKLLLLFISVHCSSPSASLRICIRCIYYDSIFYSQLFFRRFGRDWDNVLVEYYLHEKYSIEYWANVRASIDSFHCQWIPNICLQVSYSFRSNFLFRSAWRYICMNIWHHTRFGAACRIYSIRCVRRNRQRKREKANGAYKTCI